MVGIYVFLLLSFCLLFFLTEKIWIKIKKNDFFTVEIHFPILAIEFSKSKKAEDTRVKNKKRRSSTFLKYPRILSTVYNFLEECEIEITQIILPIENSSDKYYKYHTILFGALAYLKTKAKKLFIQRDGLILSPDATDFSFDLTIKVKLYKFILSWWSFRNKRTKGIKRIGK